MANFKWYINRAKIMTKKEVIHRIKCRIYDKQIESGYRIEKMNYTINFIDLPKFRGSDKENNELLLKNCESILKNNVDIFNMKIDLNYDNKFLKDPFSKKLWSSEIYTKVSFRKNNLPGDPKIIWEINKQQYLVDLGLAYQLTGESKYAEKILDEIKEWIIENPEYSGINWTSGLEISLRCLSWIFSLSLIKDYIIDNNVSVNKILHYIRLKSEFIFNKLSLYSSANNHLIGELTLLLYSSYFLMCEESNRWRSTSISMLNKQINNQFYKDGVNKEQSVNYQIHTMELYFLCEYILNLNGISLEKNTLDILRKACFYIDKLSEKDGTVFNIGDEDGGHILKLQSNPNSVLDILQFGSLILKDDSIYSEKRKEVDYKLLMLFGDKYYKFLNKKMVSMKQLNSIYIFDKGGMYIRSGMIGSIKYKAMFDFGEIGMAPLNAHAHCDILSFNLNIEGKPFLVDCGTYKYHKDDGFRNYFRGVSAHNTISIDGENQFEFLGPFISSKSPLTKVDKIQDNYIQANSDCYKKLGCKITRGILFGDKYIEIEDTIVNTSREKRKIRSFFNMAPNIECIIKERNLICKAYNKEILIKFLNDVNLTLIKGKYEGNIVGWFSKEYYKKTETYTLIIEYEIEQKSEKNIKYKIKI